MKYGVLVCSGDAKYKNIGDYIQSIAQEQFLPQIDCFIEREQLNSYKSSEKTKLVFNAWFMHNPQNFPPSNDIEPLLTSMHIVPRIEKKFFSDKTIEYLKQHAPVGARDTGTMQILQKYGIDSFFSGCLTLTLGVKYKSEYHNDKVYFVDPYYEIPTNMIKRYTRSIFAYLKYYKKIKLLSKRFVTEFHVSNRLCSSLDLKLCAALFYDSYSKTFSDEVLLNAEYVTHKVKQSLFEGNDKNLSKMEYARNLLIKYSKAKYVVTSRIHCSLPCLGIETLVLFVTSPSLEAGVLRSSGRFGGLKTLLNSAQWTPNGLLGEDGFVLPKCITKQTVLTNKEDYKYLRDKLIKQVNDFVKD